ncbi:MAG: nuclear transport factor 2 family protein [Pseudomonadota bacterium]|nr:nuclear transport factor 2 family protein [Pseudomonadota bacterium]
MSPALIAVLIAAAPTTGVPTDLDAAVHRYDAAQVKSDKAELEVLLADDYLLVNSGGDVETKQQFIADQLEAGYKLEPFTVVHPIERRWTDGAVMGGLASLKGLSGGKAFAVCLRFADIWRRDAGVWHVAYTQAARAKPEDCAATK